jgi:hypothetical protein
MVAGEQRYGVAVFRVRGGPPAPHLGLVDEVVMEKRGDVQEFDGGGGVDDMPPRGHARSAFPLFVLTALFAVDTLCALDEIRVCALDEIRKKEHKGRSEEAAGVLHAVEDRGLGLGGAAAPPASAAFPWPAPGPPPAVLPPGRSR